MELISNSQAEPSNAYLEGLTILWILALFELHFLLIRIETGQFLKADLKCILISSRINSLTLFF